MKVRTTLRPRLFNSSCTFFAHALLAALKFGCDFMHSGGRGAYLLVPAVMCWCSVEDNSGEILRSFLTLCSPTSVSDDTGDADDVEVGITFPVKGPRFVSTRGGRSSFRRFGGGGSDGSVNDGVDTELLNLHLVLLIGWAGFEGGVASPPVSRGCLRKNGFHVTMWTAAHVAYIQLIPELQTGYSGVTLAAVAVEQEQPLC